MTIREHLVSISSIPSGTAKQHLEFAKTNFIFIQRTDTKLEEPTLEANSDETMSAEINEEVFTANFIEN